MNHESITNWSRSLPYLRTYSGIGTAQRVSLACAFFIRHSKIRVQTYAAQYKLDGRIQTTRVPKLEQNARSRTTLVMKITFTSSGTSIPLSFVCFHQRQQHGGAANRLDDDTRRSRVSERLSAARASILARRAVLNLRGRYDGLWSELGRVTRFNLISLTTRPTAMAMLVLRVFRFGCRAQKSLKFCRFW